MGEWNLNHIKTFFQGNTPSSLLSISASLLTFIKTSLLPYPAAKSVSNISNAVHSPCHSLGLLGRVQTALLTLVLLISAIFISPNVYAAGEPGAFMGWGAGARSLGMGRAFLAVSDDASASYWNPAAMVQLDQKELMGLQATLFEDTTFQFFSYVHPTSRFGTWGINMTSLSSAGFEKVDVKVDPASSPSDPNYIEFEELGDFAISQSAITLAYGKQVTKKISMGFSLNQITNSVDTLSQSMMGINASVFSRVNKNYRMGLSVRNVVSQAPADSDDRLPLVIRLGNAYSLLNDRILVAADLNSSAASGFGWNLGTEYWATRRVAIRLGLENRDGEIAETTAGFGFKLGRLNLDLAVGLAELGMSQRMSMSFKFGKSAGRGREGQIGRLIKSGKSAFARGQYAKAVSRLEAALAIDPSNKKLQTMVNKLQSIAGSIPAATGDGELDRLVRQGVSSYVSGDLNTAYDSLRTAFEKNPSNQSLMNFTNKVARQAGQPLVEPPKNNLSGARWTLVDQKLHDALTSIYEGRYDVAISKCEQVLRIDPSNVTAIGRMGAAFFLLGENEKAITLWKRALELEPNNQTAIDYLRQLGVAQ